MIDKLTEEKNIQRRLNSLIENTTSFRFNSGAGSGKTHALKECLTYLLRNKFHDLSRSNQKILCATYTNVAVKEIKQRLGESDVIIVSTIHDLLWNIIKIRQKQLVELHEEKIKNELSTLELELNDPTSKPLKFYSKLDTSDKELLETLISESKDIYYKSINYKAAQTRELYLSSDVYSGVADNLTKIWFKSIDNFRTLSKKLYKRGRLIHCLSQIEKRADGYTTVNYDTNRNSDQLHQMLFSHDTLLEYSYKLFVNYPMMCRMLIDKYPYLFIDEYQDTSEYVVRLVKATSEYADNHDKDWLIGYFGDTAQTIYGDGVGSKISDLHGSLEIVDKPFNRRSHTQIIDIINEIRDDTLKQETIDDSRTLGEVKFYSFNEECKPEERITSAKQFLDFYKSDIEERNQYSDSSNVHCLVLTNKMLTALAGFNDVYQAFSKAGQIYHETANQQILGELEKLHPTVRLIYRIVKSYSSVVSDTATYHDVFGSRGRKFTLKDADKVIDRVLKIEPKALKCLVSRFSEIYDEKENDLASDAFMARCFGVRKSEIKKFGSLEQYVRAEIRKLVSKERITEELTEEQTDQQLEQVQAVLSLPMKSLLCWVQHIDKKQEGPIIFHTYHGTKGEEYENVAVLMEHSFGQEKNKLKSFFEHRGKSLEDRNKALEHIEFADTYENTKNLIYVACSRATRNLRVLYLDSIAEIEPGIKNIFSELEVFPEPDKL